jgi:hypothetical protein
MSISKQWPRRIFAAFIFLVSTSVLLAQEIYNEPWRPQSHFTPPKNFMIDRNGLVYYKGEYRSRSGNWARCGASDWDAAALAGIGRMCGRRTGVLPCQENAGHP